MYDATGAPRSLINTQLYASMCACDTRTGEEQVDRVETYHEEEGEEGESAADRKVRPSRNMTRELEQQKKDEMQAKREQEVTSWHVQGMNTICWLPCVDVELVFCKLCTACCVMFLPISQVERHTRIESEQRRIIAWQTCERKMKDVALKQRERHTDRLQDVLRTSLSLPTEMEQRR